MENEQVVDMHNEEMLDQEGHILFANDRYIVRLEGGMSVIRSPDGLWIPCRWINLITQAHMQSLAFIDFAGKLHHAMDSPPALSLNEALTIASFMVEEEGDAGEH